MLWFSSSVALLQKLAEQQLPSDLKWFARYGFVSFRISPTPCPGFCTTSGSIGFFL